MGLHLRLGTASLAKEVWQKQPAEMVRQELGACVTNHRLALCSQQKKWPAHFSRRRAELQRFQVSEVVLLWTLWRWLPLLSSTLARAANLLPTGLLLAQSSLA